MLMTNTNVDKLRLHSANWAEQIKDAMNVNGGDIENAENVDYVMHFITFGWKVIFSLVPPVGFLGGWLTFFVSLGAIGLLTAIIGDMAGIFGCLVGLRDTVTAITFVSPGNLAPRPVCIQGCCAVGEKYADNAIGNVTGSNSVNVFLGLRDFRGLWRPSTGTPRSLNVYHVTQGQPFKVPSGSLVFSVSIYCAVSITCIALLMLRRKLPFFGKAELGGPRGAAIGSAVSCCSSGSYTSSCRRSRRTNTFEKTTSHARLPKSLGLNQAQLLMFSSRVFLWQRGQCADLWFVRCVALLLLVERCCS
ncbi:hypothetical protein HPB48_015008 [Haemaphysalis longicornis]|uniref:Sodium/calcium exchanger membrane region domain-containing protein n=1 Tax=Haemaphysalis longicornis TaxID=44386 RepID=A0A9J6FUD8_HAELO|nr:hypothetical protein HPB48_015008 [Haemaphysalis longicornis]